MAKVKFKLSAKRSLEFNVKKFDKKIFLLKFLHTLSALTLIVFFILFAKGVVSSTYKSESFLYLLSSTTVILLSLQIIKLLLGGIRYFPESVLDLFSLLFSIALISSLLTKQLFDFARTDGMLPSLNVWFMTIVGFLILMLFSYLIDIESRKRNFSLKVLAFYAIIVELFVIIQAILGNELVASVYIFLLFVGVINLAFLDKVANKFLQTGLFINSMILFIISIIYLDAATNLLFMLVATLTLILGFLLRVIDIKILQDIRNELMRIAGGKLHLIKIVNILPSVILLVSIIVYWMGFLVAIIFGKIKLSFISDGASSIFDAFKSTSNVQDAIMGGAYDVSYQSLFANLYSSYGILGLSMFILFVSAFFVFVAKGWIKQAKRPKYFELSLVGFIVFITVLMFVSSLIPQLWIFYIILIGLSSGSLASINEKQIHDKLIDFSKIQNPKIKFSARFIQVLLIIGVLFVAIYFPLNVEELLSDL